MYHFFKYSKKILFLFFFLSILYKREKKIRDTKYVSMTIDWKSFLFKQPIIKYLRVSLNSNRRACKIINRTMEKQIVGCLE